MKESDLKHDKVLLANTHFSDQSLTSQLSGCSVLAVQNNLLAHACTAFLTQVNIRHACLSSKKLVSQSLPGR